MKRSYQAMIFATLCLAAMVSPVAVQAQLEEDFVPEVFLNEDGEYEYEWDGRFSSRGRAGCDVRRSACALFF